MFQYAFFAYAVNWSLRLILELFNPHSKVFNNNKNNKRGNITLSSHYQIVVVTMNAKHFYET